MRITYIQTGGTLDKDYPRGETSHGYEFEITESAMAEILPGTNALFEYDIVPCLRKDSLDITDEDREKIYKTVQQVENNRIIITHGTDTISKTAERLADTNRKTIVLTGAMLPNKFTNSDAKFNVGLATAAVQILDPGVYIALYGVVVSWKDFPEIQNKFNEQDRIPAKIGYGTDTES